MLDDAHPTDRRMALNQNRPLGNGRFYAEIEAVKGQRREPRKLGRLRMEPTNNALLHLQQQELAL